MSKRKLSMKEENNLKKIAGAALLMIILFVN